MSEAHSTSLRDKIVRLLDKSSEHCGTVRDLTPLERIVEDNRTSLDQPMRVAFVGRFNVGKSTMLNAFLGEKLAATGNGPVTYNVSWIRHGTSPEIHIHLNDGSVVKRSMSDLDQLTTRGGEDFIKDEIHHLEFQRSVPMLRKFDLIDTPGLFCPDKKDSENTLNFLLNRKTRPHALVFLFSKSLSVQDIETLGEFQKISQGQINGLNAIGGLTNVDTNASSQDPISDGKKVVQQLAEKNPKEFGTLYSIVPVVGQTGFGAQILEPNDLETLDAVARLPTTRIEKLLLSKERFSEKEYPDESDIPPVASRKRLFDKLDLFGTKRAVAALREGVSPEELPAHLVRISGVERLRNLVVSHFGNRAFLLKARTTLGALRSVGFPLSQSLKGEAARSANEIVNLVDRILINEPRFREFTLLESYYAGKLELVGTEVEDLLLVTGEKGTSCAHRLGLEDDAPMENLIAIAQKRLHYWRAINSDPFGAMARRDSASILMDSYGHILNRIRGASEHHKAAEELLAYES